MLKELYSQYGEVMVQMEILQARLNKIKSEIFTVLQSQPEKQTECCANKEG